MSKITSSDLETGEFAQEILEELLKKDRNSGLVLALQGELGSGKTQFVKGAASFLNITGTVTSPTFILMKRYQIEDTELIRRTGIKNMYHFDCYRIKEEKEIAELDWNKIVSNPENIVFVEWPENIKGLLPDDTTNIYFEDKGEGKREIVVEYDNNQ